MRFGLRQFNLVVIGVSLAVLAAYLPLGLVVLVPIAFLVVFDGGRAEAIDVAHWNVKQLRGTFKEAEMIMLMLASQNLSSARVRLVRLKAHEQQNPHIKAAIDAIENYYKTRRWWHFR
jgi:hypothetical protein